MLDVDLPSEELGPDFRSAHPCKKKQGWGSLGIGAARRGASCNVIDRKERHTRMDKKGRGVIPASFRRALGVKSSEVVVLRPENDELRIDTVRHRLVRAQKSVGEHVAPTVSLVDERIAERREDARRESDRHR